MVRTVFSAVRSIRVSAVGEVDAERVRPESSDYAQALNQTSTLAAGSTAAGLHPAGGIVGSGYGVWMSDVYAIGGVTGTCPRALVDICLV